MIVIAEDYINARNMHTYEHTDYWKNPFWGWAKRPENVILEYLGEAKSEECSSRIVMTNFKNG